MVTKLNIEFRISGIRNSDFWNSEFGFEISDFGLPTSDFRLPTSHTPLTAHRSPLPAHLSITPDPISSSPLYHAANCPGAAPLCNLLKITYMPLLLLKSLAF